MERKHSLFEDLPKVPTNSHPCDFVAVKRCVAERKVTHFGNRIIYINTLDEAVRRMVCKIFLEPVFQKYIGTFTKYGDDITGIILK